MFNIRPAEASERRRVLRRTLASSGQSPAGVERQVDAFLAYAEEMRLDLSRHWIAADEQGWRSACTYVESPGRTAMIFLPPGPDSDDAVVELLRTVCAFAESRGMRLLQCLVDPDDPAHSALPAAGFQKLARLEYLERPAVLDEDAKLGQLAPADLTWLTYSPERHALFATTIQATYAESLDCPGLNGLRDIEDVLAGHKGAARFDPQRWWLVQRDGETLGCLLLGEIPLRSALEVVYMGLVPSARGRRLSHALLTRTTQTARAAGLHAITLAVDARNAPALGLYGKFCFQRTLTRDAWIRAVSVVTEG